MHPNSEHEKLLVDYLLGELPEAEQIRLEERFFTDEESYQELLALEDELRYDYAAGGLTPAQRTQFAQRFLATTQGRDRTEFASAVLERVAAAQVTPVTQIAAPTPNAKPPLWQSLLAAFRLPLPVWQFGLAMATLLLFAGASWLFYQTVNLRAQVARLETARTQQTQQTQQVDELRARQQQLSRELERERTERAQLEKELAQQQTARSSERQPASSSGVLAFILAPGLVRDENGLKRLTIPSNTNQVRLSLRLKRPNVYQRYHVVLQTLDGVELWQQSLPRATSKTTSQTVAVTLTAGRLQAGDYLLGLKGQRAGGALEEIDDYYFSIVRP